MAQIPKGLEYVKSISFFLKIGAFIVLLIALVTLGLFLNKADISLIVSGQLTVDSFDYWERKGGLDFGMFAIVVSWLVVMIMVAFFITGLHEKITIINWPLTVAINMIIWGVLLFISGCIIADTARKYDDKTYFTTSITFCDMLKTKYPYNYYSTSDARCGHLVGASITCFITTIIFGVDAFFNIQLFRGKETPSAAPPAVPT